MTLYDLEEPELKAFKPVLTTPKDFGAFWKETLSQSVPLALHYEQLDCGINSVEVFDCSFAGFGGSRIKAWLLLPKEHGRPLPCIVEYIGYGGGRSYPWDWLGWSACGFAHFVMDTRGQGSSWARGDTPDEGPAGFSFPGVMTRGIESPHSYYFRRLMTDAVHAVEAAASHSAIDPAKIAVTGISQGGGLAISTAALSSTVRVTMPDVPFLCNFRRACDICPSLPYTEIASYLRIHRDKVESTFATLAYFDGMSFASITNKPALYSVALMDEICPPSTVFSAYNWHAGSKKIEVYPFNGHEGGGSYHFQAKLAFANAHLRD